jgi:transaldolase
MNTMNATEKLQGLGPSLRLDNITLQGGLLRRWDSAVRGKVPDSLSDQLGIAIGKGAYKAHRDLIASPRWQRAFNAGARPQRLLFASTGTKDPRTSDVLYSSLRFMSIVSSPGA